MLLDDFAQAHEVSQEESRETHRLQQLGMRVARLISPISLGAPSHIQPLRQR
jgi:cardiolipin synthase